MSVDTFLHFISVIIAAIDIGIVLHDRLAANKHSNKPSQSDGLTVNILVQNNSTAHGSSLQAGTVYLRDYSSYGKAFFALIFVIGLVLQKYFRIFIILISISTLLALIEAKWTSHAIYVPLLNTKRLIWFASPSVILISSLTVNLFLDFVTFPKYFGNINHLYSPSEKKAFLINNFYIFSISVLILYRIDIDKKRQPSFSESCLLYVACSDDKRHFLRGRRANLTF